MAFNLGSLAQRGAALPSALFASILLASMLVLGVNGWRTWEARNDQLNADRAETANLAHSLARHAHDSIQAVDILLLDLRERIAADGATPATLERLQRIMRARVAQIPGLHGLFIYDEHGDWVVSSAAAPVVSPSGTPNNADRAYFQHHRSQPDTGAHIGPPIRSRSDNSWVVTVSRRVDGPDGVFRGVVLATLSVAYLADFYGSLDVGPGGILSLVMADGTLIARNPFVDAMVGRDLSGSEVFRRFLPHAAEGSFAYRSIIDLVERVGSYRRTPDYPLVLVVAHRVDDVLAVWRRGAIVHLAISVVLACGLSLLGFHFSRQVRRAQAAERQYRLLADNSSDAILCLDRDGLPIYASPAFTAITGWSATDTLSRPWHELAHPEDAALLRAAFDRMQAGEPAVSAVYRYPCGSGEPRWVEASLRLVSGDADGRARCVATIRDVSERKAAEARLAAANRELGVLARTDALTGIANRRRFDEALDQEWRRGARDETPVSLLMVDVDRFKLFNDEYGHPLGDACLRQVAQAIDQLARRPGDLVARYGGEEIVVLLANTDAAGALALGGAICAAIRALAIAHACNLPDQVVTVSIGASTRLPRLKAGHMASGRPEDLTGAADKALYQAKNAGRNRVVADIDLPVDPLPPVGLDEAARLAALAGYDLERPGIQADGLDRLARLTAALFRVPVALVSIVGQDMQRFVGRAGTCMENSPRETSFCAHAIAGEGVFSVADASVDPRFVANPLVTGELGLRFYAGAPLVGRDGHKLGALCILDQAARVPLLPSEKALLRDLSELAVSYLEGRPAQGAYIQS